MDRDPLSLIDRVLWHLDNWSNQLTKVLKSIQKDKSLYIDDSPSDDRDDAKLSDLHGDSSGNRAQKDNEDRLFSLRGEDRVVQPKGLDDSDKL